MSLLLYAALRDVHVSRTSGVIITGGFTASTSNGNAIDLEPRTAIGNLRASVCTRAVTDYIVTHYRHRFTIPRPVSFTRT